MLYALRVAELNAIDTYRTMVSMRLFEEAVGEATASGEIHGEMHLGIGQEAIAAALAPLLQAGDAVVSTHRPHLHALAHGVDPVGLLAELLEREGLCHGKGGHMHLFDAKKNFMCTGIVGAGAPLAAGYAYKQLVQGGSTVTVAVLGDGAMNQGGFFETANLAALWNLPMIFLCEDNGYGISVRREDASAGALEERGEPFGIPGVRCDGTDPHATFAALEPAFVRARRHEGQSLIVATCYRHRGHYEGDLDVYRSKEEKEFAMSAERDPVTRLQRSLLASGTSQEELERIEQEASRRVEDWIAVARAKPHPNLDSLREDVFV
jgi:acetoin:2,6-dichlorophenolindophenol oxidoreductase subunit alpha